MKTMTKIILSLAFLLATACEGPPGEDGLDGTSLLGSVFEIEGDFTAGNEYMLYFEFPNTIEVFESDVVLVYILWEQVAGTGGKKLDVWRLLPQTIVLDEGVLQYNFDYTMSDVQIFLDGSIDFSTLLPAESQDQIFRIVVLPADFAITKSLDISNYNLMMNALGVNQGTIQRINPDYMKGKTSPALNRTGK